MKRDSLLGMLASKFSPHPENLATEALCYILNRSSVGKAAFLDYFTQVGVGLPGDLIIQTQHSGEDESIPDIVGSDAKGRQVLVGEAKFWAGLTENQPCAYLKRLPKDVQGVLIFIAPVMRLPTLWSELLTRCKKEGLVIAAQKSVGNELSFGQIDSQHILALASWRSMLAYILRSLETQGQVECAADVSQLMGLCERMDDNAFLPLRSEELTANIGARIVQYCQLVDEVIELAVREELASTKGLKSGATSGQYGRYIRIHSYGCWLGFQAHYWAEHRSTPLWLGVYDAIDRWGNWLSSHAVKEALAKLDKQEPSRLLEIDKTFFVPLDLPTCVEKDEVVKALLGQLRDVAGLLSAYEKEHGPSAFKCKK